MFIKPFQHTNTSNRNLFCNKKEGIDTRFLVSIIMNQLERVIKFNQYGKILILVIRLLIRC